MEIRKCHYDGCGKELVRKDHESLHAFHKRIYCDIKCAINGARKAKHWRNEGWITSPGQPGWKDM